MSSSSTINHLSDFHDWLQQKREAKVSFLPWVRTMLGDETLVGMKWDDFIGKPRPNRPGKKLDAFNALFQVFSRERSEPVKGAQEIEEVHGEEEEESDEDPTVGNLKIAFGESLSLQPAQEENDDDDDRPVTPPARVNRDEAPMSSKPESFAIDERKGILSIVSWNTHSFRFMNRQDQRLGMARVLSSYDLILLQEIPCGEKARESLEYFCSIMDLGGSNPFDFLLSETLTVSSSSLNAIVFRRAEWHVIHTASLPHHLNPPMSALLKRKSDDFKVFVSSVHVSPSSFSTSTPAKNGAAATPARIRAQKETMQTRIYSDVTEIHTLAQRWGCISSADFAVLIAGDFNGVPPASVSEDLALHAVLPPYFITSIASRRTPDNFLLSTDTLKSLQPAVDLIKIPTSASDHYPITLCLKKY